MGESNPAAPSCITGPSISTSNGVVFGACTNFNERPDETFAASNFGGVKDEYDVFKGLRTGGSTQAQIINGVRDAWSSELFAIAARDLTQPTNYAAIEQLVDIDKFINYSIGILYTADRDGPTGWLNGPPNSLEPKNFYATRRRTPDGRFRFWRWDSEFTLENVSEDVSERNGYENPGRLHYNLRVNPDTACALPTACSSCSSTTAPTPRRP